MKTTATTTFTQIRRRLNSHSRLLGAHILLTGLVGISAVAIDDGRTTGTIRALPRQDPTASWDPSELLEAMAAPAWPVDAPEATALETIQTSAPTAAAVVAPAPPPTPPPSPVVNEPPPRPNRSAPAPPNGVPPPPPKPGSAAAHPDDFPDPFVLRSGGAYWAFATRSGDRNVPTMRSTDLLQWSPVGDGLAALPSWSTPGLVWGPSVLERGATFVMYYATRHAATGLQCISRAVSVLPQGPYVDHSRDALLCQPERGGSIDPSPFVDEDGQPWLLWKSEGTLKGEPTRIWSQRLGDDGLGLLGAPAQLLQTGLPWEGPIIEGPSMTRVGGRYHLFYSGNRWETAAYAVGHAVCASPAGPCRRTSQAPIVRSGPALAGPGGQEVVRAPTGEPVLVHHAWEPGRVGYPQGARRLHISTLHFDGDRVRVGARWTPPVLGA